MGYLRMVGMLSVFVGLVVIAIAVADAVRTPPAPGVGRCTWEDRILLPDRVLAAAALR